LCPDEFPPVRIIGTLYFVSLRISWSIFFQFDLHKFLGYRVANQE
jgi:hypothetical protein